MRKERARHTTDGARWASRAPKGRAVLVATLILGAAFGTAAWAQTAFEPPAVFSAATLAAPNLLTGPGFTVDSQVPVETFLYRFTIRADVGLFEAHGLAVLPIRIQEVKALQKLQETSNTAEFAQAVAQAGARPIMSAVNMLTHPVDTITGLPGGIERMFGRVGLGLESIGSAASNPDQSAIEQTGKSLVVALGYEAERRKLAKELGVDPYTANAVLRKKLNDVAWVRFAGRLGVNLAISAVPGSIIISSTSWVNTAVYDTPAGDLMVMNEKKLQAMGVPDATVKAFTANQWLTLSLKTALVEALGRLADVPGREDVVAFAIRAASEDEARFVVTSTELLARYHQSGTPIALVTAPGPIVGRTATGGVVVPASLDYVAWIRQMAIFVKRPDLQGNPRIAVLAGKLSPVAKQQFGAAGWTVQEGF
jgi:hypothetical protein